ncbi:MAG: hypothetical protein M3O41_16515 [Pseudomonadota bacterium]|nr:hypothetical protein [Pseudomonadota bacterium]
MQKYAWANLANASDIARDLFGVAASGLARTHYLDLLWAEWIFNPYRRHKMLMPSGLVLDGYLTAYGSTWPKLLASAEALRYCSSCLREGFHSTLFQIEGLLKCPRHHEQLRTRCPHCDIQTVRLGLLVESFAMPFHCVHCSRPLSVEFDPKQWFQSPDVHREIEQALYPIDSWLRSLDSYSHKHTDAPFSQLSIDEKYKAETEALVSFEIALHLAPLSLPDDEYARARRPLSFYKVTTRPAAATAEYRAVEFMQRHAIYKSVRKYILRTHCFGHRRCLVAAKDTISFRRIPPGFLEVVQDDDVCPIAAAFTRWDLVHSDRKGNLSYETRDEFANMCVEDGAAPNVLFTIEVLAHFYSCVATAYEFERCRQRASANYPASRDSCFAPIAGYNGFWSSHEIIWAIKSEPGARDAPTTYLLVFGSPIVIKRLEEFGGQKCARPKGRRRIPRRIDVSKPPSHQISRKPAAERWHDDQVRPYESARSILFKYLRQNKVSASKWQQLIFADTSDSNNLLTGRGVIVPQPAIAAGEAIVRGTLRAYGPRWRCRLTISERVRICPECRDEAYHCIFFQIENLVSCPWHKSRLTTECKTCGAMTPSYNIQPSVHPIQRSACKRCGDAIFTDVSAHRSDHSLSADHLELQLKPLVDWIRCAERTHRTDPRWHSRLPIPGMAPPRFYRNLGVIASTLVRVDA